MAQEKENVVNAEGEGTMKFAKMNERRPTAKSIFEEEDAKKVQEKRIKGTMDSMCQFYMYCRLTLDHHNSGT